MVKNFVIKEFDDQDMDKVFELRKNVYGVPFDQCEWDWKFQKSVILLAVNSEGVIVGIRPTIILKLKYNNNIIDAGMNVDVMTHTEYQRMGIFTSLVRASYLKLSELDVNIVYTFPNELSFPGYSRTIKWNKISSIPLLVKPVNTKNIINKYIKNHHFSSLICPLIKLGISLYFRKNRIKENNNLSIKEIKIFGSDFDNLWNKISSKFNIIIVRDSKFLNWRYVYRPNYNYKIFAGYKGNELVGYVVCRVEEMFGLKLGIIADILALDDHSAIFLIENAFEYLVKMDVDVVGCLMLSHVSYYQKLREFGFREIPKYFSPKEFYFVAKCDEEKISKDLYSETKWYVTFGDIDIS